MNDLGKIHQIIVPLGDHNMVFNVEPILMAWIVMGLVLVFGYLSVRGRSVVPHRVQVLGELIVDQFFGLTEDALDKDMARKYGPMICALFLFLWISNMIGVLPPIYIIPEFSEPTKDLNVPLSFGIMGFFIAHYAGIKAKGFKAYIKAYLEPFFFMAPLNIIGELAKVISISFRLFGNIMGGSIIILVVSYLTFNLVLPPGLYAFFGLFIGTIQAFVFTMLTVVYISVQVN